ncbi:MAG TPA: TIGR02266 family protein [Oligoflexia bacterium]|nr:TIGR02266 family protein [Oligoflexia bacterium]HMR24413.1 TIGR02266 family protein [Oligoflexia bacterium]
MQNFSDQRESKRVPVEFKVDFLKEGNFLFENATNISEHGIFLETDQPMELGTVVHLKFTLPDSGVEIEARAEVMWINPVKENAKKNYHPGMGLKFVQLSDLDRQSILAVIKKLALLESMS